MLLLNADAGWEIVAVREDAQPLASVTVQVHVPAKRFEAVAVVCAGDEFQLYAYGEVPPVAATVAFPVAEPKHNTFVWAERLDVNEVDGCVITALRVAEQPRLSVTVQVHVPATRLVAVNVFCTGTVFQL